MRSSKRLVIATSKKSTSSSSRSVSKSTLMTITPSNGGQCPMEVENTSANVNVDGGGTVTNGEVDVELKIPALDKYNLRVKSIQKRIEVEKKRKNPRKEPKPKQRPPPLSKYRRKNANARERTRMQEMNQAFVELKKAVPQLASDIDGSEDQNSKLTKITTLRRAVKYIAALTMLLSETEPEQLTEENSNSIENNSTNGNINYPLGPSTDPQPFICSNISSPSPSLSSVSSSSSASYSSSSLSSPSPSPSLSSSSSSIQSPSSCSSLTLDLQTVSLNNNQLGDNLMIQPNQMFSQFNGSSNQINYRTDITNYPLKSSSNNQPQDESQFALSPSTINNHHHHSPPPPSTTPPEASTINLNHQQLFSSSLITNEQTNQQPSSSSSSLSPNEDANLTIYMGPDFSDLPVDSSLPLLDVDCYSYLPDGLDDFKLITGDMIPESDFESFRIESEILSNPLITSW